MALTQEAFDHYKNLFDSAESDTEREELSAGIERQHATDNYVIDNKEDLRRIGREALGKAQPEQTVRFGQNKLQSLIPSNDQARKDALVDANGGDVWNGLNRGIQNLQAMSYGATALGGSGLKKIGLDKAGQAFQNFGMEGYRRNVEEAKQYEGRHSFKDVYTGKAGFGGAIDWAQGTLGELIPSMAEAAIGAAVGALAGTSVGPEGTIGGGAVGAFAGRTVLKKFIDKGVKTALKEGIIKGSEAKLRKIVTTQALKKLGGKIGLGAAILPIESGGMYASLLEEKGIDAPGTALFFGALQTALEYVGGNSKLVDTFMDALSKGSKGIAKKTAKELLINIPEEALQEGGQQVFSILNEIVNTGDDFFTADHIESIVENMAAGAVGGGAGALVGSTMNPQSDFSNAYESKLTERFDNIMAQGVDKVPVSIDALNQKTIKNEQMLQDTKTIQALAAKAGIEPIDVTQTLTHENEFNQELTTRLQKELNGEPSGDIQATAQAPKQAVDIESLIANQQAKDTIKEAKVTQDVKDTRDYEGDSLMDQFAYTAQEIQAQADVTARKNSFAEIQSADLKESDILAQEKANLYNSVGQKVRTKQEDSFTPEEALFFKQYTEAKYAEKQKVVQRKKNADVYAKEKTAFDDYSSKIPLNKSSATSETSSLKDEQQVVEPNQVDQATQVSMQELESQLTVNQQQLDAVTQQLSTTTDPNERMALQQEGSALQAENDTLQAQWTEQYQAQDQVTQSEAGAEFQTTAQQSTQLTLPDIESMFPNQQVSQDADGTISVKFKNGQGVTFKSIQDAGKGFVKMAIETGQMSENGKILGITVGNDVLLDANYADNNTMWHENKHVLDNLGMITKADDSALNAEFNKLRKAGKLKFALSTAIDSKTGKPDTVQRMKENRANMFAQIMVDRAAYRGDSKFKAMIQRVMDFFQQMYALGNQSIAGLARDVESGNIYERQSIEQGNVPKFQIADMRYTIPEQVLAGMLNKRTETNTPEFKQWFDKSVAKTQEGAPLVFYHGTDGVFESFEKNIPNQTNQTGHASSGLGHFFTLKKDLAGKYGQHVLPTYLKMNNPYMMSLIESQSFKTIEESAKKQKELKAKGYDSIIIETGDIPYTVVFDSGQTKSIYNQGQWKDPENIYFQTREQADSAVRPEQKVTDAEYAKGFNKKNNIIQNIKQITRIRGNDLKLLLDKGLGSISTRLDNANPSGLLKHKIRRLDLDTSLKIIKVLKTALPLLETAKNKMSPADRHAWDLSRKQADESKVYQLANKYGLLEHQENLRDALNSIRDQARKVGYDVGFIDEYWPRMIKDTEGFLQAFYEDKEMSARPIFTEALKAKAKKMGVTIGTLNRDFPEVRADIISSMILGNSSGIGGPGNIQGRKFDKIPDNLVKFYMDSDAALMRYIYSMTKKIEARKFFGKVPPKIQAHKNAITKAQISLDKVTTLLDQPQDNPEITELLANRATELNEQIILHDEALNKFKEQHNYTENIGAYIDELMLTGELHPKNEKVVKEILEARFNEHGTTGVVNAYKNLAYIDVMGNVVSAMTQIADLAWGAYVGKVWTPRGFSNTVQNTIAATLGKSKMTKEELGIERIAQEFADGTTLGNAVSKVFKVVGLTKMDSIGKEVLINNVLMNYQEQIKTDVGRKALAKEISSIFGKETNQVITDLGANTHSDNVKMLIYSKVLDFQPVGLSEMPELYLKGGNGRIFYMLKTYTIKQMDVFRNEVFKEIKSGDPKRVKQGLGNMVALVSLLTLANAGTDELKDLVMGKETRFKDNVIENFLSLGGASRYMRMQVTREGIGASVAQQILPPFKFINAFSSDIREKIVTGDVAEGLRSVESIPSYGPIGGKLWYWHFGRGSQTKRTLNEKDFSKENRRFNKFKKQLEKATDKRLFLQSNPDEFRQMKLHQNFSTKLNGNKVIINKLKKLEQTPNVLKRIDQLEAQRKMFYDRYFEAAKNLAP